jgi:drug/metabolite transporter (DMT)-like permease
VACIWLLGEPADRRGVGSVLIGTVGIAVIVAGGWQGGNLPVILVALTSGAAYAVVVLGLRVLRDESPLWLTVLNHLFAGVALLPFVAALPPPSPAQFSVLFLYGSLQMALPYWLMARSLRALSPQEAGTLSLIEPVLNPLWAFLVTLGSPQPEVPKWYTFLGGAVILMALAYRYWPQRRASAPPEAAQDAETAAACP